MFFEGKSIYSYGHHFEMARFIDDETVFVTTQEYVSTAKHLSLVRRAVSHKTVYTVPSFTDHKANLTYFIESARENYDKAKRARTQGPWFMTKAQACVYEARRYREQFGVRVPSDKVALWEVLDTGTYLDSEVAGERERSANLAWGTSSSH